MTRLYSGAIRPPQPEGRTVGLPWVGTVTSVSAPGNSRWDLGSIRTNCRWRTDPQDVIQAIPDSRTSRSPPARSAAPPTPAGQCSSTRSIQTDVSTARQFEDIIVKRAIAAVTRVARCWLGGLGAQTNSQVFSPQQVPRRDRGIFQYPGARWRSSRRREEDDRARARPFPQGIQYERVRHTEVRIRVDPRGIYKTLIEAGCWWMVAASWCPTTGLARDAGAGDAVPSNHRRFAAMAALGLHINCRPVCDRAGVASWWTTPSWWSKRRDQIERPVSH